jgi:hypothetical protein
MSMLRSFASWAILALGLSAGPLVGSPLQDRIGRASSGDYLVVEGGKVITVLSIRSVTPASLVLEEVSIPSENLKKRPASWSEWIKAKAPGHTSWSMIELDRASGEILECYSFTRASWVQLSSKESLLATLMSLPLELVPREKRRKIGPPPQPGEIDTRKIWEPPALFEGKKQEGIRFDVYETTWPQDPSPLSGNTVVLYFDREGKFPLPFWIQVETAHANVALRTIDTGKNFPSPYRKFPKRVPQFIGEPQKVKSGLKLTLKSPKYFRHFELFAIDVTTREKVLCPIAHTLAPGKEDFLTVEIPEEELQSVLKADHRYTWLLVPTGHSESYTETTKPFAWTVSR